MTHEEQKLCIRVILRSKREGNYTVYAFEDLDYVNPSRRYIMCTKCPNWNGQEIMIGQEGFLSYQLIIAGKNKWYNAQDGQMYHYRHTANYFHDFVPVTHVVLGGRVVEQQQLIVT